MRFTVLALLLSGCAAVVQVGPAVPDPTPTVVGQGADPEGEIIVYRAPSMGFVANVATAPEIAVDGQTAGKCLVGHPLVIRIAPGPHQVSATVKTVVNQVVKLEAGVPVYLRCGTAAAPSLTPAPVLVPVDRATASREAEM